MKQNAIPEDCPIQDVFKNLRSIEMLKQQKQENAYQQYFNIMYEELKKHPFPSQPFSALNIVENFLSQHLQEYIDAKHIPIMFLILNVCLCPSEMIHYMSDETSKSLKLLKRQILSGNFLENVMNYIILVIQQGNENMITYQQKQEKIQQMIDKVQEIRKELTFLRDQQYMQTNKSNTTKESLENNNYDINVSEQDDNNQQQDGKSGSTQQLTIDQRFSSEIIPEAQQNSEHTEISEIQKTFSVKEKMNELRSTQQKLSNLIAELKEENLNTASELQDTESILIQFLTFVYNIFITDTSSNEYAHQQFDSTGLISAIQLIIDIVAEYSFFEKLKPYCFKVSAAIIISQQRNVFGCENIIYKKKKQNTTQEDIKLKILEDCANDTQNSKQIAQNIVNTPNSYSVIFSQGNQHIPISAASSVSSYLIQQVQTHGIGYFKQSQYDYQITNIDFSAHKQKHFKRISKKDNVVDDYGEQIQTDDKDKKGEKKTMPVTDVPLTFNFLVEKQKNCFVQQKNAKILLESKSFYTLINSYSDSLTKLTTEMKKNFFLQYSQLEYFSYNFFQDEKGVFRAFTQIIIELSASIARDNICWPRKSVDNIANLLQPLKFFSATVRLAEIYTQEFLNLQGELKQFSYEYFRINESIIHFMYVITAFLQELITLHNSLDNQIKQKLRAKISFSKLKLQNGLINGIQMDVHNLSTANNDLDQAIIQLDQQKKEIKEQTQIFFDIFIASDILELLRQKTRDWALIVEDIQGSSTMFLKMLRTHLSLLKLMKEFQDEGGMIRVLRQRKRKIIERSSDVDEDLFSNISDQFQIPEVPGGHNSGLDSSQDEHMELIDDTESRWSPEYIFVHRLLHGGIIEQIHLLIYSLVLRSKDLDRYAHIDICLDIFNVLQGFENANVLISKTLTQINSLCMIEQMLEIPDTRLKKLFDFYNKICQQIHLNTLDSDHIYQFLNQLILGEDFRYNAIFDSVRYDYKNPDQQQQDNIPQIQLPNSKPEEHRMGRNDMMVANQFIRRNNRRIQIQQQTQHFQDEFLQNSTTLKEESSSFSSNQVVNNISDDLSDLDISQINQNNNDVRPEDYQLITDRLVQLSILYGKAGALKQLMEDLGYLYSEEQIAQVFQQNNLNRPWTQQEREYLMNNQLNDIDELAEILWRTQEDVTTQLQSLLIKDKL